MAGYLVSSKYKGYLDQLGFNGERILKKSGIPIKMESKGIFVTREQFVKLMTVLSEETTDEMILLYSKVQDHAVFIPAVFAGLCASNGKACFERISEYKKLVGPFVLNNEVCEKIFSLEFNFDNEVNLPLPKFSQMTETLMMINLIRTGTGKHIVPKKVESSYKFSQKLVEFIGIEPLKSDKCKIYFTLSDVEEPFITENNIMWKYLEPELKKRKEEMEVDKSFAAKVRTILFELIPSGNGNIETVSREMALSSRTLQRKLSEENTTFMQQLNHTRELLAKNYLLNGEISTEEVAYLIGYSDVYAFMRAFRQWTCLTIKQYRTKHGM